MSFGMLTRSNYDLSFNRPTSCFSSFEVVWSQELLNYTVSNLKSLRLFITSSITTCLPLTPSYLLSMLLDIFTEVLRNRLHTKHIHAFPQWANPFLVGLSSSVMSDRGHDCVPTPIKYKGRRSPVFRGLSLS